MATSLSHGESVQKQVGILHVCKNKFRMQCIDLQTVRPFVFHDVLLSENTHKISKYKSKSEAVEEFVDNYIEENMIADATKLLTGN